MSSGKQYLNIESARYRPWAARSNLEKHIRCIWCDSDFLVKKATGVKGHESTEGHLKKAENYKEENEQKKRLR